MNASTSSLRLIAKESGVPDPGVAFFVQLVDELSQGPLNLPCFPNIVPRVRQALDDPSSSVDDIVRIVATEPRLAAKLVQTASSAVFNTSGKPVANLKAAVSRLGRHLVQSVTMVFMIQQIRAEPKLQSVREPLTALWDRSLRVALLGQSLARQLNAPTEKVFLTGLMHGIGQFYAIIRSCEPGAPGYSSLRQDLLDEWQPPLSRAVLRKWGFDEVVCDTVAQQHNYARESTRAADIVDVLIASVVLADAALHLQGDLARTDQVTAFQRLGLSKDVLQQVMQHSEHTLSAMRASLS